MDDKELVHGMVLKHRAVGDYDWIVTLLTVERGKITAFAKGARKMNARLAGLVEPLCMGTFSLYQGRSSFTINEAHIDTFFESFRKDLEKSTYATFFLEVADYYNHENAEAKDFLNLLYMTLKALDAGIEQLTPAYIRCVYEIRALVTDGSFPGADSCAAERSVTRKALTYIASMPLQKLYSFLPPAEAREELVFVTKRLRRRFMDYTPKSLEMLAMYESP